VTIEGRGARQFVVTQDVRLSDNTVPVWPRVEGLDVQRVPIELVRPFLTGMAVWSGTVGL
jgi:hypothetical protein